MTKVERKVCRCAECGCSTATFDYFYPAGKDHERPERVELYCAKCGHQLVKVTAEEITAPDADKYAFRNMLVDEGFRRWRDLNGIS